MSNDFNELNARDTKKVLDNCFVVAKDRFINILVDDVCNEISYFISNEIKTSKNSKLNKEKEIKRTLDHLDYIQKAFFALPEKKMTQIKQGYLSFFANHTISLSKEERRISKDFIYALLDTLYHYFYQVLMRKYENEIRIQYKKAYSLLSLQVWDGKNIETIRQINGLINDEAMKERVLICGEQLSYRKGDEKYLFFKFLLMQNQAQRHRPLQQSSLKGMARKIIKNDKYVIDKIKTIPNYFVKLSKHHFKDII